MTTVAAVQTDCMELCIEDTVSDILVSFSSCLLNSSEACSVSFFTPANDSFISMTWMVQLEDSASLSLESPRPLDAPRAARLPTISEGTYLQTYKFVGMISIAITLMIVQTTATSPV